MLRSALLVTSAMLFVFVVVASAVREGKTIPSFQTTSLDGKAVTVRVVNGKVTVSIKEGNRNQTLTPKVLLLDFWATWCPPCQVTSKWLADLHRKYQKKGLLILAISVDEDGRASVKPFVEATKVPYFVALDPKAVVANRFRVEGLPTLFIVNEKGVIVRVYEGLPDSPSELERSFRAAGL